MVGNHTIYTYDPLNVFDEIALISIRWLKLKYAEVELIYFYNLWTKHSSPLMYVHERQNGERVEETVNDFQKIEELFQKSGTSLEEVRETLNGNLEDMLKDWIRSNDGESRFSENHYGWYTVGELQIGSLD